jgi:Mlc titration factor MtfA (ptsG expression regulator)
MNFIRVANKETAIKTIKELEIITPKLINLTTQFGINTYCFDKQLYPSWIGLLKKSNTFDGRSYDETACFLSWHKSILLYDWDFDESEYAFSTVIHEYAHALDYTLGSMLKEDTFLSNIHPTIYNGWQKQRGLDCYANLNPREYFAQAFMAYFQKDKERYKPKKYYEHTCEELKEKDNDMYYFIDNLVKTI